jgi:hypothetical protein
MMVAISKRAGELPRQIAMLTCLALLTLYWPRLANVGGFSIEPYHLGIFFLAAASVLSVTALTSTIALAPYCLPWLLAYAFYLALFVAASAGTSAFGIVPRQLLFIAGFLLVAAYCFRAADPAPVLRYGGLLGLALFLVFVEICARRVGRSFATAIPGFLASGSLDYLLYKFFRPVFNSFEGSNDVVFRGAVSNVIAVSVLVLTLCHRIGFRRRGVDWIGIGVTALAMLLAFVMNARSVAIAAVGGVLLAWLLGLCLRRATTLAKVFFTGVGIICFASLALMAELHGNSALDAIASAFSFEDSSTDGRLNQYRWAFSLIDRSIILGNGYIPTATGIPIHNLFLSSWAYTGLAGFLLVLVFYFGILAAWIRFLYLLAARRGYWLLELRPEWVAVLPILPLFRMWLSGDGGHLAFGEWIALAVFFGLIARNESRRRTVSAAETSSNIPLANLPRPEHVGRY